MVAGYFRKGYDRAVSTFTDVMLAFPPIVIAILVTGRFDALRAKQQRVQLVDQNVVDHICADLAVDRSPCTNREGPNSSRLASENLCWQHAVWVQRTVVCCFEKCCRTWFLHSSLSPSPASPFCWWPKVGLAFLGYSIELPTPTWGRLIAENRAYIREAWWGTLTPCLMLFLTVLSFNLIGDRMARRFDIREATL